MYNPSLLFLFSTLAQHGLAPFAACSRSQNFKRWYLYLHWTFSAATFQILFMLKQQHTGILQSTTPVPELILDELFDCPTSHLDGRQCRLCSVPRAWLQPAAFSVSLSSQRIPPADEAHQSSQPQCQTFCSLPCWTDPGLQFQTPPPQYYSYSPGTSSIRHTATGGEGEHWGQMIF